MGRKERHCSFSPIAFKALLTLIVSTCAWKVKVKRHLQKVKVKKGIFTKNKTLKLTSTQKFHMLHMFVIVSSISGQRVDINERIIS